MLIALDFDGVVTADPQHWRRWVALARIDGHEVITVTSRGDTYENRMAIENVLGCCHEVVFAHDEPKKVAALASGFAVEIWIDDQPHMIGDGSGSLAVVSVWENELRHAHRVLTDGGTRQGGFAELIARLKNVVAQS